MRELIKFCFEGGEKQFIAVKKFGATWTDNKNKFKIFPRIQKEVNMDELGTIHVHVCLFLFLLFVCVFVCLILLKIDRLID